MIISSSRSDFEKIDFVFAIIYNVLLYEYKNNIEIRRRNEKFERGVEYEKLAKKYPFRLKSFPVSWLCNGGETAGWGGRKHNWRLPHKQKMLLH